MKTMRGLTYILLLGLMGLSACDEIPDTFQTEKNLISIGDFLYENKEDYSSFIRVMEEGNMTQALSAYNPLGNNYSLFLPSDEAFEKFIDANSDYSSIEDLIADTDFIHALSRYHVVNSAVATHNFPLGALPDSSLTGDYLIIAYIQDIDSTYFKVNNRALVVRADLEMTNGIVHVIDQVLEPVTFTGFDWLRANEEFSILADLFELTGVKDQMGFEKEDENGNLIDNRYSILAESNSIFQDEGINSIDDLVDRYGEGRTDYTDGENPMFQMAAYHILDASWFLADLYEGVSNYNTRASLPLQISTGVEVRVNTGVQNFDSIYVETDSSYTYINYLLIDVYESNIQTRNGPIHLVDHVLELYRPARTVRTFQFYEEPLINEIRNVEQTFIFTKPAEFTRLLWSGVDEFYFTKSSSSSESALNRDFIALGGDFSITYKIPKILPGVYGMQIRVLYGRRDNSTIQVYLDGKKMGGNMNLTTAGANNSNPYRLKNMGIIEFGKYEEHTVTIRSLIPGVFAWDYVRFQNNLDTYDNNNQ